MDILKIIFKFFVVSLLLTIFVVLGLRQYLIARTVSQIGLDYRHLFRDYNTGTQEKACALQLGQQRDRSAQNVYQLRFVDRRHYRLEVLCGGLISNSILIKQQSLPPLVFRNNIGSGFVVARSQKEVVGFKVFQHATVNWQNQLLEQMPFLSQDFYLVKDNYKLVEKKHYQRQDQATQIGPVTECAGYGFNCCDPNSSIGQGQSISRALDCPESCFTSCQPRPVVLAFNASGNYNIYTKTVTLSNHDVVDFAASINQNQTKIDHVLIDFGDGRTQKLNQLNKIEIEHQYDCPQTQCLYTAKIKLVTVKGISSLDSSIAHIKVLVQN